MHKLEAQSRGQEYCSMANNESVATLLRGAALPETLVIVAVVLDWAVSEYFTGYGRMLDARRLAKKFSDGQ